MFELLEAGKFKSARVAATDAALSPSQFSPSVSDGFRDLIPPLSGEALAQLEEKIKAEGNAASRPCSRPNVEVIS